MPLKRIADVFCHVIDMDVLEQAAKAACRHRKDRKEVAEFKADSKNKLLQLRESV